MSIAIIENINSFENTGVEYSKIVENIFELKEITEDEIRQYGSLGGLKQYLLLLLNAKRANESEEDALRYISMIYVIKYCKIEIEKN